MEELILIAGIHILGAASPGPDLALVLKNSLTGGKKIGIYTAAGIASGIGVHVLYSMLGLAVIISRSIVVFNTIKLLGAAYLIWIGFKALQSKKSSGGEKPVLITEPIGRREAVRQGFITNILNPKVTLFFLSLFTQVISPETSNLLKLVYGTEMILATFTWFTLVAVLLTQKPIQKVYDRLKHAIDKLFGTVLIGLGIKVAISTK